MVELIRTGFENAELIHRMKYEAFLPLYVKYQDHQTSPVKEPIDKVKRQLLREDNDYYLIRSDGYTVGAVRAVFDGVAEGEKIYRVSPLFVLPEFQGKGMGYAAMTALMELYPQADIWRLSTIKEEKGNCHLYEKCGFRISRPEEAVNERMTIVYYERRRS